MRRDSRDKRINAVLLICSLALCLMYVIMGNTADRPDELSVRAMRESKEIRREIRKKLNTDEIKGFSVVYSPNDGDEVEAGAVRFDGRTHSVYFDTPGSGKYVKYGRSVSLSPDSLRRLVDNVHFLEFAAEGDSDKTRFTGRRAVRYIESENSPELRAEKAHTIFENLIAEYCYGSIKDIAFAEKVLSEVNSFDDDRYVSSVMARFNRFGYVKGR